MNRLLQIDRMSQAEWRRFCRLTGRPEFWQPEDELKWLRDADADRNDEEWELATREEVA